jgi:hypothetical protein
MRDLKLAVGVIALVALAACGSKDAQPGASSGIGRSGSSASAASTGPASAEQVAKEARGNVNCPARVTTPVVAGGPVIDVVGLRPGITYEEAANIVLCDNPMLVAELDTSTSFNIQTYGQTVRQGFGARFAEARIEKTSRQIMKELQDEALARGTNAVRQDMKPGQVKFHVGTMGVPGQERAIYAAREEWFTEGKNPAVDVVAKALTGKYGDTTRSQETDKFRILTWAYDPNGRRLTETSPLYNECRGVSDPDGDANFTADCGVVVQAQIGSLPGNQGLAQYIQVGVIDQAAGYAAISGTESALHKLDEDRKAKELKDATKNADVPKL